MHRYALCGLLLVLASLAPATSAHGSLAVHELETLVISDFEGGEESYPWEGFEIWDVYVGEAYNDSLDMHGVYIKANFAGDGTLRPTGGSVWSVVYTFRVGEEEFEREFAHDGSAITTTFEGFESQVADGNVLQVKGWVPVPEWEGKAVTDIVLVSLVDGSPRDTAPGGIHDPVTGAEIPVKAPATPVFPEVGQGRIVDEVPLQGASGYLDLAFEAKGEGRFTLTVTNPLAEQGQHVMLDAANVPGWTLVTDSPPLSLDGGKTGTFDIQLVADGAGVAPFRLDVLTDIGGLRSVYASLTPDGVALVEDPALASNGVVAEAPLDVPVPAWAAFAGVALAAAAFGRRRG